METEDFVKQVCVDLPARKFTIISDSSEVEELVCDDSDQFLRVLGFVRATCQLNEVSYKY
jgi:hypothetical protein